ncbi:MAG: gliding motility-associated C-terminal domain-containing protein [Cytophagales bacterium]
MGSGANSYTWLPANITATSVNISIPAITTVTVLGTDLNGCVGIDTETIAINTTITAVDVPLGVTSRCEGAATNTYQLPNAKNFYNATSFSWAVSPSNAGVLTVSASPNEHVASMAWQATFTGIATISVTGVDACGNFRSNSVNVSVNQTPVVTFSGHTNPTNCTANDGSITVAGIAASGNITYINQTLNTTVLSGIFNNLSASPISTYTIEVLDVASGCSTTIVESLTPAGLPPTPNISGTGIYCASDIASPIIVNTGSIGNINLYRNGSPASLVASVTGTNLSYLPSVSGSYFATVSDGGCVSNNSASVNVLFDNFALIPLTSGFTSTCVGSSAMLAVTTVGNVVSYDWYGNTLDVNFGNTVNATPTALGINLYTVVGTGINGCLSAYIFTVNGIGGPTASLTAVNQTICGNSITLSMVNNGGNSITYFDGSVENTVAVVGNFFTVPLIVGSNTITLVSVSGATCGAGIASGSVTIVRRADADPICTCTGRAELLGGSGSVCEGGSSTFNLVVSVAGTSPLSLEILQNGDINNRLTFTGLNAGLNANLAVSPAVTTDYTIYRVNTSTCQGSGSGSVRVNVTPVPNLSVTSPVIVNCTTSVVDLSNYFVDLNTTLAGTVSYWADANYTIQSGNLVTTTGTYFIRKVASGLSTCTGEAFITVNFQTKPTGQIFGGSGVCSGQSTSISALFLGGAAPYTFTYGNATTTSTVQTTTGVFNVSVVASNDVYTISGIADANGCAISTTGFAIVSINPTSICGGGTICTTSPSAPVVSQQTAQCGELRVGWIPILADYFTYSLVDNMGTVINTGTTLGFANTFTGLVAGLYNVEVSATNGCGTSSISTLVGLNATSGIGATITGGGVFCNAPKVILNVAIAGGVAPYRITLNNDVSYFNKASNFTITVLGATENYTVVSIADASGCDNLISSVGTDVVVPASIPATVQVATKFNSSCQSGVFVFTATGMNAGSNPTFVWKINNSSVVGINYSILGINTLDTLEVISFTGFVTGDKVSAQLLPNSSVAGCISNANNIASNTITITIENINLNNSITYIPTQCLNSNDGVLYINLPSKYFGRTFGYEVNTIVGSVSDPLITVGGLTANKLSIKITDLDNPQCTLDTITGGTGTVKVIIIPQAKDSDCNANNGSISLYFESDFPTYNATIFGVNTSTGFDVVSIVSFISDTTNNYTNKFDNLGIGIYKLAIEYNNCFATVPLVTIGGGVAPDVDLGEDRNICLGDSITITTGGFSGGLYSWIKNDTLIKKSTENFLGIKPLKNETYSVIVPGSNGCTNTDFISVNVSEIKMQLATTALQSDTSVKIVWTYVNKAALPKTDFAIQNRTIVENSFSPWISIEIRTLLDTVFTHRNESTRNSIQQYRIEGINDNACVTSAHSLVYLKGFSSETDNKVNLNWSRYSGWAKGVDHYEVWRKIDEEAAFTFVNNVANDTTIDLSNVVDGFKHEYRILAVSKEAAKDSIKSWSNIININFNREIDTYNAFSPNGDGVNDFYEVKNILSWPNNEIFIFNRWGGKVYYAKPYKNDWNGEGMPDGTYFYIIKLNNQNNTPPFKGSILLQR